MNIKTNQVPAILFLTFISLIGVWSIRAISPPEYVNKSKDETLFSAEEAFEHVKVIAKAPHSIGTSELGAVKEYIVQQCIESGLAHQIQSSTVSANYNGFVRAANISNIIVYKKGTLSSGAVLLMAHYDSHINSHGAADNGSGVATLIEVMKILSKKALKNDVILLFTDGEEVGSFGAKAFVEENELFKHVKVALNLEARGSSGITQMFETNAENGWIIKQYSTAVKHSYANSLNFEIYKLLPHDTDFSVFKDKNVTGLNHAFVGEFENYHSVRDIAQNLSLRSLQHQGDNAIQLVEHLSQIDLSQTSGQEVTYFNIFGPSLVYYPALINSYFYIAICMLFCVITFLALAKGKLSIRGVLISLLVFFVLNVLAVIMCSLFIRGLVWKYPMHQNTPFDKYASYFYLVACMAIGLMVFVWPLNWLINRYGILSAQFGSLLVIFLELNILRFTMPSAQYLLSLPLIFILFGLIAVILFHARLKPIWIDTFFFVAAVPCVVLLAPAVSLLFEVFGISVISPVMLLFSGAIVVFLMPLIYSAAPGGRYRYAIAGFVIFLGSIFWGHTKVKDLSRNPDSFFVYYEADLDKPSTSWITDREVNSNCAKVFFKNPRYEKGLVVSDAPFLEFAPPELTVLSETTDSFVRTLRVHLSNPRKSLLMRISFDGLEVRNIKFNDRRVEEIPGERGIVLFSYYGVGSEGFTLDIETTPGTLQLLVEDFSSGLPVFHDFKIGDGCIPAPGYSSNTTRVRKAFRL